MREKGALDLEGSDPVACAINDVIRSARKVEVAVRVPAGCVTGEIVTSGPETLGRASRLVVIAAEPVER
jgi:hypothetical protein